MLERECEISLPAQAELLSLSRSSLYYEPVGPSAKEIAHQAPHRRDLHAAPDLWLAPDDGRAWSGRLSISRPTVQRYMREMGIAGIAPGPNTSQPTPTQGLSVPATRPGNLPPEPGLGH